MSKKVNYDNLRDQYKEFGDLGQQAIKEMKKERRINENKYNYFS